jgi:ATP sulfurylase
VPIVEQTATRPDAGLPHGGLLVDRRLDAGEAAALAASRLPSLPLTADPAHPGVAAVLGAPSRAVAGPVRAVVAPLPGPLGGRVLTPLQTRAAFQARGWRSVVGYQPGGRVRRSDRRLLRRALATVDGLLLQPLVGPAGEGAAAEACLRAGEAVLGSLPPQRVLPAALMAPTRHAGAREALLHALVGKNHGCTHVIAARGRYRALLASLPAEELGVGLITRRPV